MAFNFYGTFTIGQFDRFDDFSKYQQKDISRRIDYLTSLVSKIGTFNTEFSSGGSPVSYSAAKGTYAAKLLDAYRALGGIPEKDFIIRSRNKPVFKTRGVPLTGNSEDTQDGGSNTYSNQATERGFLFDRDVGIKTEKSKSWMLQVIKRKREYLEYKIKRTLDYSDQLIEEINYLTELRSSAEQPDYLVQTILATAQIPGANHSVPNTEDTHGTHVADSVDPTIKQDIEEGHARGIRGAPNQLG